MIAMELRDHINGLKQVFVKVHPVTGKANYRVGYYNPKTGGFGLIAQHELRESHIKELEDLLDTETHIHQQAQQIQEELRGVDESGDSGGGGSETGGGTVS